MNSNNRFNVLPLFHFNFNLYFNSDFSTTINLTNLMVNTKYIFRIEIKDSNNESLLIESQKELESIFNH